MKMLDKYNNFVSVISTESQCLGLTKLFNFGIFKHNIAKSLSIPIIEGAIHSEHIVEFSENILYASTIIEFRSLS